MKIKRFEFNMLPVNTYVLWDETNEAALIDAGCFTANEQQTLKRFIDSNGLQPKVLLNTHLHFDHLFGNAFVYRTWGIRPQANAADEFLLEQAPAQCRMFGFEINEPTVALGGYLKQGDVVEFGHTKLHAIAIPGHSPGGMAFYNAEDGCLFSGDSLFQGSIGRTDLAGGSFDELREAIRSRLFTLPPETVVYPGHDESTTIGKEMKDNPYFR